jgi:hypothetical protein
VTTWIGQKTDENANFLHWIKEYLLSFHFHFSCRNLAKLFIGGCMHVVRQNPTAATTNFYSCMTIKDLGATGAIFSANCFLSPCATPKEVLRGQQIEISRSVFDSYHHVRSGSLANFQNRDCPETGHFPSRTPEFQKNQKKKDSIFFFKFFS